MTLLILITCALLEAGADYVMGFASWHRSYFAVLAVIMLTGYSFLINRTGLPFIQVLGMYVGVFFVVTQLIGVLLGEDRMTPATWCGGALIVAGSSVIAWSKVS